VCVKWELLLPVLSFVCVCAWSVLVLPQVGRPFEPFRADDARRWLVIQASMGMTPERGATPHIRSCASPGTSPRASEGTTAAAGSTHGWDDAVSIQGGNATGNQGLMMISDLSRSLGLPPQGPCRGRLVDTLAPSPQ
jgi:hypothetical protein